MGSLPGESGGPGSESLARKWQDTGARVPSGEHGAFGQKSLAWEDWESGVGSLAGERRGTEKELLWREERGTGTGFLEGVQQGPDPGFLLAGCWGMTEVRSAGPPCPAAGPRPQAGPPSPGRAGRPQGPESARPCARGPPSPEPGPPRPWPCAVRPPPPPPPRGPTQAGPRPLRRRRRPGPALPARALAAVGPGLLAAGGDGAAEPGGGVGAGRAAVRRLRGLRPGRELGPGPQHRPPARAQPLSGRGCDPGSGPGPAASCAAVPAPLQQGSCTAAAMLIQTASWEACPSQAV